jgi:hypothetical protein
MSLPVPPKRCLAPLFGIALLASCARQPPAERLLWTNGAPADVPSSAFSPGDIALAGDATWIAYTETTGGAPRIQLLSARGAAGPGHSPPIVASFAGESPSLLRLDDGSLVLVSLARDRTGAQAIVVRRGTVDGTKWSAAQRIATRPGRYSLASGRAARAVQGAWLVAAVHHDETRAAAVPEAVCLRSEDAGTTWRETPLLRGAGVADAAIVEVEAGRLLGVVRIGTHLVRCESNDDGATWGAPEPTGVELDSLPFALQKWAGGVALAWTDPPPDSTEAAPGVRALRLALSADAGHHWQAKRPLVWRAAGVAVASALAGDATHLTALCGGVTGTAATLTCIDYDLQARESASPSLEHPGGRYSIDPARARAALELLCAHTLERPFPSRRMFIESYFMRALVTAGDVLKRGSAASAAAPGVFDATVALKRAVAFGDALLRFQDDKGYWPLGYRAVYMADMGVVVDLFTALAAHVEPAHARQYEAAAVRFATALERDGMLLPTGAYGVGWTQTEITSERTVDRTPYLVSTALAGVELHAWLFERTHEARYRSRAIEALDYTLSQLAPDGSFPSHAPGAPGEGAFLTAAYVQEGWMAADVFLNDGDLRQRWRTALPAHIAWLLRSQQPNGTWGSTGPDGEFARTPAILSFLIWYDERVEAREDVRQAIRRASVALLDPDQWRDLGLMRAGKDEDVLRAITLRPLASMAADRFVF